MDAPGCPALTRAAPTQVWSLTARHTFFFVK
jgi:hypothetical protein